VVQRERRNYAALNFQAPQPGMVGRQCDDLVRNQIPPRVGQDEFRHRVTSENLSGNGSARHRLPAQLITVNLAEVRRLDFVNTLRRRLLAGRLRVNLAAQARDNKARMVNRLRRNSTSSSSEAARLPQPITARDKGSRKVGRRNHQKRRHPHGHNNFGAITPAAPERKIPEPLFVRQQNCRAFL
jgi:hypothetical protein